MSIHKQLNFINHQSARIATSPVTYCSTGAQIFISYFISQIKLTYQFCKIKLLVKIPRITVLTWCRDNAGTTVTLFFSFLIDSPLAWLSSAMTVLPDAHHRQTPPLAFRDSCGVGTGIWFWTAIPFPLEKLGLPTASAKSGVCKKPHCIAFQSDVRNFFLYNI